MLARGAAELARAEPLTVLVFLGLAAAGVYALIGRLGTESGARTLVAFPLAIVSLVHGGRTDARFLVLAGRDPRRVFAVEYALLAAPAVVLLLAAGWPLAALAAAAGSVAFAIIPAGGIVLLARRRGNRPPMRLPLPPRGFEWISGVRRHWDGLLLIELGAAVFSFDPAGPLGAIVALAGWAALLQLDGEPRAMLEALGGSAGRILREKVLRSLGLFLLVCAPPALLFLLRHAALWPLLVVVLAWALGVHAGCVFAKYALYRDGRRQGIAGPLTAVALMGAVAIVPVGLFLVWRLRRAALRNLHAQLHDHG
jgi:hypothetical protein